VDASHKKIDIFGYLGIGLYNPDYNIKRAHHITTPEDGGTNSLLTNNYGELLAIKEAIA